MDFLNNTSSNFTHSYSDENETYKRTLKKASNITALATLCVVMMAMGADISWKQIWAHLRRPVSVAVGMISQFIVMPLLGFAFINATTLSPTHSVGVLLMSCCPGGALSNVFTYFLDGDIPLSVTMTTLSTLFAMGLMPFNLWFYGMWVDAGELVIPYAGMAASLAYATAPAAFGMVIRWKFPTVAVWITKVFTKLGFVLIAVNITLINLAFPDFFTDIPPMLCIASVALPSAGFLLGFCFAWVTKRTVAVRKTISLESGVQNIVIAFGTISVSPFTFETQKTLSIFPTLYGIATISLCFLFCLFYQLRKKMHGRGFIKTTQENAFEENNGNEMAFSGS